MINDVEIDLTEHRDFGRNNTSLYTIRRTNGTIYTNVNRFIVKQIYGEFPWEVIPIYEQDHYKYDGLVALGNKEARRDVIESYCWGSTENKTCDCCGREYKKIPWKQDAGICKSCLKIKD